MVVKKSGKTSWFSDLFLFQNRHSAFEAVKSAKEYHERALAINLKRLVPDHTYVAASYHYLGRIYRDLGNLERVKEYHERALAADLQRFGPHHTEVATSYRHLGRIHRDLGDLECAKEYYERCLPFILRASVLTIPKWQLVTITWAVFTAL